MIGAVKTAVLILGIHQPVRSAYTVIQPAFMRLTPFFLKNIRVQNRLQAVSDLAHPQRLRLVPVSGQVHPESGETGIRHGMFRPEIQDPQSFFRRLRVLMQPAPAEQLITNARLLTHKTDFRRV